ncbi:MAG: hypothetical protein ACE366_20730 [Bradymonadia bacterium]
MLKGALSRIHAGALCAALMPAAAWGQHVPPPQPGAPLTLGQALDGVGAFAEILNTPEVERLLRPVPPPVRPLGVTLLITGGVMALAGLAGTLASPTCGTRDAELRCVDRQGPHWVYPSMMVFGLGTMISGTYWYRLDYSEAPPPVPAFE